LKTRARETNLEEDQISSDPALRASGVQARAERAPSGQMQATNVARRPLVSIGVPADPAMLEPTYAYLSAYCFACLAPQVAQKLNVAIYELYANALRCGTAAGEVRLEIQRGTGETVTLSVSNHASPTDIERLKTQLERVQEDPGGAFLGEMNRFAGGSQPPPMLGLVRVAHECNLQLGLRIDGDHVLISASCDA
jgi:anti-sigma regulatory factor (Ser/Thr protein kinase)